jgi:preprotein translocase subunit SecA
MNSQREVIYKRRKHALFGERIKLDIANMFYDLAEEITVGHHSVKDFENFKLDLFRYLGIESPINEEEFASIATDKLVTRIYEEASKHYLQKGKLIAEQAYPVIKQVHEDPSTSYETIAVPFTDGRKSLQVVAKLEEAYETEGKAVVDAVEKSVTLAIIDNQWKEHLRNMDGLRSNVQFAQHEQKDPLLIYKFESYELFKTMINEVNTEVGSFLMRCTLPISSGQQVKQAPSHKPAPKLQTSKEGMPNLNERAAAAQQSAQGGRPAPAPRPQKVEPVRTEKKVGRNEPCPCGSGKKYKNCHGAN